MPDANYYREKAKTCRRLASGASSRRSHARRGNYLIELAERFEREAARLEARFAGNKPSQPEPGYAQTDAAPAHRTAADDWTKFPK
jgi:hypothetical protein